MWMQYNLVEEIILGKKNALTLKLLRKDKLRKSRTTQIHLLKHWNKRKSYIFIEKNEFINKSYISNWYILDADSDTQFLIKKAKIKM